MNKDNLQRYELVGERVAIFQRGRRWYTHYRLNGKPIRQSLKTTSKKQARLLALAIERDLLGGDFQRPTKAPLIGDVIEAYIAHLRGMRRSKKTVGKYQFAFRLLLELAAKRNIRRINQIDLALIDAFRAERVRHQVNHKRQQTHDKTAKDKTIRNDLVVIKQLVNFAVRRKMIRENPLADLTFPKLKRTPQPYWPREQVEEILRAASKRYRSLFHFLADTGVRIGEARWLTWADIDLENGIAHIRPKDDWTPKSGDERVIHLSNDLCELLGGMPRVARWVFTAPTTERFPSADRQVSDRRALAHLKVVLKKVGLPGHLHTFRHSFISHALTSGVPEPIVRRWVGHVDHEIIEHYTHVADRQSRSAMDQILPGNAVRDGRNGGQGGT